MDYPRAILDELRAGEQVLWVGGPRRGPLLLPLDSLTVIHALIFAGFFVAAVAMAPGHWQSAVVASGGVGWILLTLWYRFFSRSRQIYVATNQRVFVKQNSALDRTTRSVEYGTDFSITPIDGPQKTTHVFFGPANDYIAQCMETPPWIPLAFKFLENAVPVIDLVLDARTTFREHRTQP